MKTASLFDSWPETYDQWFETPIGKLIKTYETELILEMLAPSQGDHILDAGCGTGLCGPLLQGFARRLVGVDLSEGMLALARDRGIYDELIAAELTRYLETTEDRFDVVMCADTLVYFGDLHAVIDGFQRVLEADGVLVFSVEQTGPLEQDFRLLPHGRYAHNADYVGKLLGDAGFDPVDMRPGVLRLEVGQPVNGLLVTARKPA